MAAFLYYRPEGGATTRTELEALGFPHAAAIELPGQGLIGLGPDETKGHVSKLRGPMVDGGVEPRVGYYPERQTWRKILSGKMWLGWETDNPPSPLDLQRPKLRDGHGVTMADGRLWILPVIRTLIGQTALPTIFGCDDSGTVVREQVLTEFVRIWDLTQRMYVTVESLPSGVAQITDDELTELLCSGLAMNYRVSKWEVLRLGLLSAENMEAAFAAMIDIPAGLIGDEEQG